METREIRQEIERLTYELCKQLKTSERPKINNNTDIFNLLKFLGALDHEEFWVVLLDTRCRVMDFYKLYQGTLVSANVRVAEVFREAIIKNAASIAIAHNHPSGDAAPSPDDITITRAIKSAGALLDIELLDHIIIADDKNLSLRSHGHI